MDFIEFRNVDVTSLLLSM